MAANTTIVSDPHQLTNSDLVDEYEKLSRAYRQLQRSEDEHLQHIFELKRNVLTATNAETHLAAELEFISSGHAAELEAQQQRHRHELDDLKARLSAALESAATAEAEHEQLQREHSQLQRTYDESQKNARSAIAPADVGRAARLADSLERAERDNEQMLDTLAAEQERLTAALKRNVQLELDVEDLRDRLECSDETLRTKREELDARSQELECAQEQLIQQSDELAKLRSEPQAGDPSKRGNSLFAEVDDQRQHMKHVLAAQKRHYVQMKQEYEASQQEIRSLKRENAAMKKEIEICAAMFLNADQTFKANLKDQVGKLLVDIQHLEAKLQFTEAKLLSVASEKGVSWLDSMLTFCKNESTTYKDQLRHCRLQKAATEEKLNKVEMELSCWRFEALKSRCTIIHREQLLEENRIEFEEKPLAAVEMARRLDAKSDTRPTLEPKPSRRIEAVRSERKPVECKSEPNVSMCLVDEDKENVPDIATICKVEPQDCSFDSPGSIATPNVSVESEKLFDMSPESESRTFDTPPVQQEAARIRVVSNLANVDAKGKIITPNLLLSHQTTHSITPPTTTAKSQLSIEMSAPLSKCPLVETNTSNLRPNVLTCQSTAHSQSQLQQPAIDSKLDVKPEATTFKSVPTIRRIIVKSKKPTLYPN